MLRMNYLFKRPPRSIFGRPRDSGPQLRNLNSPDMHKWQKEKKSIIESTKIYVHKNVRKMVLHKTTKHVE